MKENFAKYGEFLLKHLNVAINMNEIDWSEILAAYEKYLEDEIIERKEQEAIDLFRPGLLYINWIISTHYKVDPVVVREGKCRKRELTKARQIGHYAAVVLFRYTLQTVGDFYGKDHATILHSRRTVQNEIDTNKEYKLEVLHVFNKLKDGNSNQGTSPERGT